MRSLCLLAAVVIFAPSASAQNRLQLEFETLRSLLPPDGVPLEAWRDNKNWAKICPGNHLIYNRNVGDAEVKGKLPVAGITASDGAIHLSAGWTVFYPGKWIDPFLDGRLKATLTLSMSDGVWTVNATSVDSVWNRFPFVPDLVSPFVKREVIKFAKVLETNLNRKVDNFLQDAKVKAFMQAANIQKDDLTVTLGNSQLVLGVRQPITLVHGNIKGRRGDTAFRLSGRVNTLRIGNIDNSTVSSQATHTNNFRFGKVDRNSSVSVRIAGNVNGEIGEINGRSAVAISGGTGGTITFNGVIDGGSKVRVNLPNGRVVFKKKIDGASDVFVRAAMVVFEDKTDGKSRVGVNLQNGKLIAKGKVDGGVTLTIRAKDIEFWDKVDNPGNTRVLATVPDNASIKGVGKNARLAAYLHITKLNPQGPGPALDWPHKGWSDFIKQENYR